MKRVVLFLLLALPCRVPAQPTDAGVTDLLRWRMIGPFRGGRTVGAAWVPGKPAVYYMGVNNGGVWRTNDYGHTWKPIFDDQPTGSIGALAVAPSNPKVIYVGSGEGLQRPDLSVGDGMFKSTDGGATWHHCGLDDAQQIGAVIVDPANPDRVFVAVLGHPYGPNAQRGVFRTLDGGASWQRVLFIDENTGAVAVTFNPVNPQIIFADMWASRQGPWENGEWQGKTSGVYRSTDGGTHWQPVHGGLPDGSRGAGRIGVTIAPNDPSRMYATVDDDSLGGIYRSDDAGDHWKMLSHDARLWGRGSDFAEVKVDPRNRDLVYVANVGVHRSTDGGISWRSFKGAPGGDDYHTILINPESPDVMLIAGDQGATISVNGGETWSSWYNQPTAQLYHVAADNSFPYTVYGGQQESGSAGVASRGNDGQITFREWHPAGADEWAYVAPDPLDPNIVYGGKVTRYNRTTGQVQNVAPEALRSGKYRTIRTMPLLFSPVDPHVLYFATNVLWKTTNGGSSWTVISPDLSRPHTDLAPSIGIYRSASLDSLARRGVIYALAPSPKSISTIWAGTDDGLVHVTHDGGTTWHDVTPGNLVSWSKIAQIDAGHFDSATAYIAVNAIRLDDQRPYVYRTHDGGVSWTRITSGLPSSGPVNVVREDPVRPGLLYAGTEREVYYSIDDGEHWQSLRRNMPATSIRDLIVKDDDLVVATHGRSFWILDNVTPLRQIPRALSDKGLFLFTPQNAVRVRWNSNMDTPLPPDEPAGENPPDGAAIDYWLRDDAREVRLEIMDNDGSIVRTFTNGDPRDTLRQDDFPYPLTWARPPQSLSAGKGVHRFFWDTRYPPPGGIHRWLPMSAIKGNTPTMPLGPLVMPGLYRATLWVDGKKESADFTIRMDPRVGATPADLREQFDGSLRCWKGMRELRTSVEAGLSLRRTIRDRLTGATGSKRDSLLAFDRRLVVILGSDAFEEIDASYGEVFRVKPGEATLKNLSFGFAYIMILLQNADAAPTQSQRASLADHEKRSNEALENFRQLERDIRRALNI